ncbi:MAG: RnfABCDGE type electron transport complex subunit C, partial [Leptotrichia sp.]|nr:RnfABCDGE type electron transport complex subunit C [Leptotrichia sp.]
GKVQNHLLIENDFKNEEVVPFSYENPDELSAEELVAAIKEIGVLGLGGSGFPTYIKYENAKNIDTVLINAVECEPYLTSDYKIMEKHAKELIDGTHFLMKAGHAKKGVIAIKVVNDKLAKKLQEATEGYQNIEVVTVPDAYPMGWERVLIRELFKKEYDRFPGEIGIIVNNATTAIYLSEALRDKKPITHRIVTISGEGVKNPENVYVPIGTSVDYIIEKIGGYTENINEMFVLGGGPMMGKSIANDTFVVTTYSNSITVLPKVVEEELPCLRCGLCVEHCPAKIQPVQIMNLEKQKNTEGVIAACADRCITCGLCTYICPSKIEVTDWVGKAKTRVANARKAGK